MDHIEVTPKEKGKAGAVQEGGWITTKSQTFLLTEMEYTKVEKKSIGELRGLPSKLQGWLRQSLSRGEN